MNFNSLLRRSVYFILKLYNKKSAGLILKNPATPANTGNHGFYDFKIKTLDGTVLDFHMLKGKKVLLVNTASACGYTDQYADLEKLYNRYKPKLMILGFPSNDFGRQEPGTHEEINAFCRKNYRITFPLSEKINVVGEHQHPIYKWLSTKALNGWNETKPGWNFCKYLVDENGRLTGFFSEKISPVDPALLQELKH